MAPCRGSAHSAPAAQQKAVSVVLSAINTSSELRAISSRRQLLLSPTFVEGTEAMELVAGDDSRSWGVAWLRIGPRVGPSYGRDSECR